MKVEVERTVWDSDKGCETPVYQIIEGVEHVDINENGALLLADETASFLAAYSPSEWEAAHRIDE